MLNVKMVIINYFNYGMMHNTKYTLMQFVIWENSFNVRKGLLFIIVNLIYTIISFVFSYEYSFHIH